MSSFPPKREKSFLQREQERKDLDYVIAWSTNPPLGYRVATFADFASSSFTSFYNDNNGLAYDTTESPAGDCILAVEEGFLEYPSSDVESATSVTFQDVFGGISCATVDEQSKEGGSIATIGTETLCNGKYTSDVFTAPVSFNFFADNFFTNTSRCDFYEDDARYQIFVANSIAPTPPSPSPPSPFVPSPPSPAPPGSFVCCGYFDYSNSFESYFCQYPNTLCPTVSGYTYVGNYSISSCGDCTHGPTTPSSPPSPPPHRQ